MRTPQQNAPAWMTAEVGFAADRESEGRIGERCCGMRVKVLREIGGSLEGGGFGSSGDTEHVLAAPGVRGV